MESLVKNQAELTQLLLAINYFSNYRHFKESLLWNEYINLENIISNLTYGQYENIRQMIEVEEIVNAIQYCLELGAVAICVNNRKIPKLGYALANLSEESITNFYREIENKDIHQIKRYMGYHDVITDKNKNYKYVISCEKYQSIMTILSKFYFEYYDLYLSYKHGLRIATFGSNNGKFIYGITEKDNKENNYYPFFKIYEIPLMHGINSSLLMCDIIKNIFDKLYIPIIRKSMCEFADIIEETLGSRDRIAPIIKTRDNLISNPTYHLSQHYAHPWWNLKDSSLEPFY